MCAYKVAYFGLPLFVYLRYGCISEYVKAEMAMYGLTSMKVMPWLTLISQI